MRKIFALVLSLLMLTASALAEDVLYPQYDLDVETFDQEEKVTFNAGFTSGDVLEGGLVLNLYGRDRYTVEEVQALQVGDKIFANNEEITIETLTDEEGDLLINGGFGYVSGATLWLMPDNWYYSAQYDGNVSATLRGQAMYLLADQVTLSHFVWDEEGNPAEDPCVVTLTPEELAIYLQELEDSGFYFSFINTYVTLENQVITEIDVLWTPAA